MLDKEGIYSINCMLLKSSYSLSHDLSFKNRSLIIGLGIEYYLGEECTQ